VVWAASRVVMGVPGVPVHLEDMGTIRKPYFNCNTSLPC
jgi:hypothetical protein